VRLSLIDRTDQRLAHSSGLVVGRLAAIAATSGEDGNEHARDQRDEQRQPQRGTDGWPEGPDLDSLSVFSDEDDGEHRQNEGDGVAPEEVTSLPGCLWSPG
jgi:hypothetical protein